MRILHCTVSQAREQYTRFGFSSGDWALSVSIEKLLQCGNLALSCVPFPFPVPLVVVGCGDRSLRYLPTLLFPLPLRGVRAVSNGCPFPQGMTSQLSCPLTVKMRVGWDEKKPNADSVSIYW